MNKIVLIILIVSSLFTTPAFADEREGIIENNNSPVVRTVNPPKVESIIKNTYKSWGSWENISNRYTSGNYSEKIYPDKFYTLHVSISGTYKGIKISAGFNVNNPPNPLTMKPNSSGHYGRRVLYEYKTGVTKISDGVTGKKIQSSKFTIKRPIDVEYKIIYS